MGAEYYAVNDDKRQVVEVGKSWSLPHYLLDIIDKKVPIPDTVEDMAATLLDIFRTTYSKYISNPVP
jgi:hypothetical protein